tara:strand:+ start:148 stop:330 length:183 start_codon:yes stop_codon:yes gene_type:complete
MALKEYILTIIYDTKKDRIEHISEYISGSDMPAFLPYPENVEVDDDYWEKVCTSEIVAES